MPQVRANWPSLKTARDSPSRADPTSTRATPPPRLTHPSPPPSLAVYLLDELVSAMRSMPTDHVDDSAEHLSRRVDHRSPVVKLKALRAIKYICERGDSRFRRAMSRHSGAIRSCVNHTGPPDPLKGDAPHRAVREMASQAVAAVFSDTTDRPAAASLSSDSSSSSSSAFASARAAPAAAPIIGDASDGAPKLNKTTGTWGGADRRPDPTPSRTIAVHEHSSSSTSAANLGFASRDFETRDTRAAPSPPPLSPPPLSPPSPTQARLSAATAAPFVLAGSEEQRRVDEACGRGGVKLAPPADVLDAFARACDGLNADGLARALADKIHGAIAPGGTWQDGYKAACCVEAAVNAGAAGGARLARAFADDAMRALRDAANPETCSNAKLREKATAAIEAVRRRVAGATGGASASAAGGSMEAKAPSPVVTNAPAGDLLGGLGATPGGLDDLLGDLSVGGGIRVPSSPPRGPAMTGGGFSPPPQQRAMMQQQQQQHAQMMMQMQQMQQMQMQQQMMGMGAPGMGMPGMGAPGMGMPGMGIPGMGMPGLGAPGMASGMGPSGIAPGMGIAASPPSSPKMGTHASAGKAPGSPNAIGGGASAYTQHKDSKAFDFVQDMLSGKK